MELVIRNRKLSESDLATIRNVIAAEGSHGRSHLSRRLCRLWDWRQANGVYREIACRDLLRQLEARRLIELPQALGPARRTGYQNRVQAPALATDPIQDSLAAMIPSLRVGVVRSLAQRQLLRDLLGAYHYLGYRQPAGPSMGYVAFWHERPVACARFGPAAWKVAVRDQFLGWSPEQRRRQLPRVVNNDRFLILPWVGVPHLASFVLGKLCQRLAQDWWTRYRQRIVLAETFVDCGRFAGVCYRAANWLCLGQSRGRGRNDREHRSPASLKSVWVCPLQRDFRRHLQELLP